MTQLTKHGYSRMKERGNFRGGNAQKQVEKAYLHGKNPEDFPKEIQRYLENVVKGSVGNMVKVSGNLIYLFHDNIFITAFGFPAKLTHKFGKNKNNKR